MKCSEKKLKIIVVALKMNCKNPKLYYYYYYYCYY